MIPQRIVRPWIQLQYAYGTWYIDSSHCVQPHQINKKKPVTSDQQDRGLFIHPFYLREHNHGIFNLVYTDINWPYEGWTSINKRKLKKDKNVFF